MRSDAVSMPFVFQIWLVFFRFMSLYFLKQPAIEIVSMCVHVVKSSMPLRFVAAFRLFSFDLVCLCLHYARPAYSIRSRSSKYLIWFLSASSFFRGKNPFLFFSSTFTSNCYYCSYALCLSLVRVRKHLRPITRT